MHFSYLKRTVFAFSFIATTGLPFASAQDGACASEDIVFYINGMRTFRKDARIQAAILRLKIAQYDSKFEDPDSVVLKYNSTFIPDYDEKQKALLEQMIGGTLSLSVENAIGSASDLLESVVQDFALEELDALRMFALDNINEYNQAFSERPASQSLLDRVAAAIDLWEGTTALGTAAVIEQLADSGDLRIITADLREAVARGQRVVIVGYSQGNYFANLAFNRLSSEEQSSVGIVHIATPTPPLSEKNPYYTFNTDRVINGVRDASDLVESWNLTSPPNPNEDNQSTSPSGSGHAFFDYLINSSNTGEKIASAVVSRFNNLTPPIASIGTGIIQVTLTWGEQPDVDLHIFEPQGAHVYYANRNGTSGTLDRDDTDGYGPENYVVASDTLQYGVYKIGVNYYAGSAPETANIGICAGGTMRTFQTPLSQAIGSQGNNAPTTVANIGVSEGPRFTISGSNN